MTIAELRNEFNATIPFPEITGTENQIAYATDLRNKFSDMDAQKNELIAAKRIVRTPAEKVQQMADKNGLTIEEQIQRGIKQFNCETAYKLLTTSDAHTIINLLK